jgi:hypothetical protein
VKKTRRGVHRVVLVLGFVVGGDDGDQNFFVLSAIQKEKERVN